MGIIGHIKNPRRLLSDTFITLKKNIPGRNPKQERLHIRLEFNRKILYEIYDLSESDTITIGRSSDCMWVIPSEDNMASGHHAVILTRNRKLCLRDTGSRNGIFHKSRKIQEKDLAPDDQFAIGNCTLFVERVRNSEQHMQNALVYLNTDKKGKTINLDKARVVVGSAQNCDIVIDEQLVSQRHTEFCSKADGCWIKDLGSKNGTFVNGSRLSANTERLLADDDVISISFVDLKFVDGKVEHTQVRIWYSLAVVAVTIFIVLAVNWLWLGLKSSSDSYLDRARKEAAVERFEQAREFLKESRTRRGADGNQIAYNELEQSVAMWENIYNNWQTAKSNLNAGNWIGASHILGMITNAEANVWGWNNTTAPEIRKEAFEAKKLLDAYLTGEASLRDDRNRKNSTDLRKAVSTIEEMNKIKQPDYREKLLAESLRLSKQITDNLQYLERLEAILARIETESDNLAMILNDLEDLKQHSEPSIRIRVENCLAPLSMLHRTAKQTKIAMRFVQDLNFEGLGGVRPELPTLEQCAVNENIATLRKQQERQFLFMVSVALNLRPLVSALAENGLGGDTALPECVDIFQNDAVMKKVFACDAFERKMPSRMRTEPAGEYDRILGIEAFYEFLYALPTPYDSTIYSEFKFQPEILKFRKLISSIHNFRTFAGLERNSWLHSGDFERLFEKTGNILAFRDKLAAQYFAAKYDDPRERILARGIAIFLQGGDVQEKELEAFAKEFKDVRLPVIQLNREYNSATDEQRLIIRDTILQKGIPGDPVIRRMWGFKSYPR